MTKKTIPISGVWVRSDHKKSEIEVLVEVDGKWRKVASELVENIGGLISHIIETRGIELTKPERKPRSGA